MRGNIEDAKCTQVTKSGCMGEWVLNFTYDNGAKRTLAFANKTHMDRAIDVIKELLKQNNTVVELQEEICAEN